LIYIKVRIVKGLGAHTHIKFQEDPFPGWPRAIVQLFDQSRLTSMPLSTATSERQPVVYTDTLRFRALPAADAGREPRRQQPVVGRFGSQLAVRRHSNDDGGRTQAAIF